MVQVKICGIKTQEALEASISCGAHYVGFVFYPTSPRHIEIEIAHKLSQMATVVHRVGLFVDPSDTALEAVFSQVALDVIQLHGSETPQRCREIKTRYGLEIIKAFGVREAKDLADIEEYRNVADMYLFDNVQGGSGQSFDWSLLAGREFSRPWMLSGGLTAENVGEALSILSPAAVDVSSGVESERGVKDAGKIRAFLEAVKAL